MARKKRKYNFKYLSRDGKGNDELVLALVTEYNLTSAKSRAVEILHESGYADACDTNVKDYKINKERS